MYKFHLASLFHFIVFCFLFLARTKAAFRKRNEELLFKRVVIVRIMCAEGLAMERQQNGLSSCFTKRLEWNLQFVFAEGFLILLCCFTNGNFC